MAEAVSFARARARTVLTRQTTPFLAPAIALYERSGFQRNAVSDLFGTPLIGMTAVLSPTLLQETNSVGEVRGLSIPDPTSRWR
jgi:hypothetical protein